MGESNNCKKNRTTVIRGSRGKKRHTTQTPREPAHQNQDRTNDRAENIAEAKKEIDKRKTKPIFTSKKNKKSINPFGSLEQDQIFVVI